MTGSQPAPGADPVYDPRRAVTPGDISALPDGRCNGCELGWERYQNANGVWLHRNASDTLGMMCWRKGAS